MSTNSFGLSRYIPADVKHAVRRRCGFGCVLCGASITEYEHFYPDFAEATEHKPSGITLLCPSHHSKVTKGLIPKSVVAAADKSPAALNQGFSKEHHPFFSGIPSLNFGGGLLLKSTPVPIRVKGRDVVRFDPPEPDENVAQVSAHFSDTEGRDTLVIEKNEWKVSSDVWDLECVGPRYIIRDKRGRDVLRLRINAPHAIAVELLDATVGGWRIRATESDLWVGGMRMTDCVASNCRVGVEVA